jgi:hypothetical protein
LIADSSASSAMTGASAFALAVSPLTPISSAMARSYFSGLRVAASATESAHTKNPNKGDPAKCLIGLDLAKAVLPIQKSLVFGMALWYRNRRSRQA